MDVNYSVSVARSNCPAICSNAITSPSRLSTPSSSTSGCVSDEYSSELSIIPESLQNLMFAPNATIKELSEAIVECKQMVLQTDQCSEERKWLVRHMVELRFRIEELKDSGENPPKIGLSTRGHHFKIHSSNNTNGKTFCDHCSGVIWSVVQGSYICSDCGYICHSKCVEKVIRLCAHIVATEKELEMTICPEKGLGAQRYKCAECKTTFNFKGGLSEPRLCDYSGLYYCSTCHWNNSCEIPARIVHNWDWEKRYVSQAAFQLLTITRDRPLINLGKTNKKLLNFVSDLNVVRKLRNDLKIMSQYLMTCPQGSTLISSDMLHNAESPNKYSISNLQLAKDGLLEVKLSSLTEICRSHILDCQICHGKGYLCELCKNDEVIFPFDYGAIGCYNCNSFFHRACWIKKNNICPKCIRMKERSISNQSEEIEEDQLGINKNMLIMDYNTECL